MSQPIKTPEAMAESHFKGTRFHSFAAAESARSDYAQGIRADREQISARCDEMAGEAKREAEAHEAQIDRLTIDLVAVSKIERIARCEGQASAFEAVAAMLRGAP